MNFLKKLMKKDTENISDAERASREFANMSDNDFQKLMKGVVRKACEDQIKILRQ